MKALTQRWPGDKEVKTFLNRMIRQGHAVVHEVRKGRPGSLYRSLLPITVSDTAPEVEVPTDAPPCGMECHLAAEPEKQAKA
ncbi:MAG: hypothetical protein IPK32_02705 [Verrucomicrobiaceae bacterium]|nr:hypothetical protein [Verrucomicrobiaceae bacterium]